MELKEELLLQHVGMRLRKLREKRGWTLREFADRSGIDNSRLSKIEQGKINITLITLMQLCIELNAKPSDCLIRFK